MILAFGSAFKDEGTKNLQLKLYAIIYTLLVYRGYGWQNVLKDWTKKSSGTHSIWPIDLSYTVRKSHIPNLKTKHEQL